MTGKEIIEKALIDAAGGEYELRIAKLEDEILELKNKIGEALVRENNLISENAKMKEILDRLRSTEYKGVAYNTVSFV